MPPPLIGGRIKRCFSLTSVCLSIAFIGPNSRTERPKKTNIGTEVAHVTRDSDTTFKVKRSKVKVIRPLSFGGSSHYIVYMDAISFYATAQREPLCVGCCKRKACMGWSWAAAFGVQGRGHIARLPTQHYIVIISCYSEQYVRLKRNVLSPRRKSDANFVLFSSVGSWFHAVRQPAAVHGSYYHYRFLPL